MTSPPSAGLTKAKHKHRIHSRIAEVIGVDIVTGKHLPGTILPNEIEASEKLEISRPVYREAIRILSAKGLVQSRPKAGTIVNPRSAWNILDPDVLTWMLKGNPNRSFVRTMFELRAIIEPAAAALAAERRTGVQLSRMRHALEEMSRHGIRSEKGREADRVFHAAIMDATGNEALAALAETISVTLKWGHALLPGISKEYDFIPGHRAIYQAIADEQPEAARRASHDLLFATFEDSLEFIRGLDNGEALPSTPATE